MLAVDDSGIDFSLFCELLDDSNNSGTIGIQHRQKHEVDFGFNSGVGHRYNANGLTQPAYLSGTLDESPRRIQKQLSRAAKNVFPNLWFGKEKEQDRNLSNDVLVSPACSD